MQITLGSASSKLFEAIRPVAEMNFPQMLLLSDFNSRDLSSRNNSKLGTYIRDPKNKFNFFGRATQGYYASKDEPYPIYKFFTLAFVEFCFSPNIQYLVVNLLK